MEQTSEPVSASPNSQNTSPAPQSAAGSCRARVFYHWKKPGAKERHGFAMGVVTAKEKTNESVIVALRQAYPKLELFVVEIDKLEWR